MLGKSGVCPAVKLRSVGRSMHHGQQTLVRQPGRSSARRARHHDRGWAPRCGHDGARATQETPLHIPLKRARQLPRKRRAVGAAKAGAGRFCWTKTLKVGFLAGFSSEGSWNWREKCPEFPPFKAVFRHGLPKNGGYKSFRTAVAARLPEKTGHSGERSADAEKFLTLARFVFRKVKILSLEQICSKNIWRFGTKVLPLQRSFKQAIYEVF